MKRQDDEMLFERLLEGEGDKALRPLMERYGDALTLLRSATNEVNHTIEVCARGMADGDSVTLEILNAEDTTEVLVKEKTAQVELDSDTGLAKCTFKG